MVWTTHKRMKIFYPIFGLGIKERKISTQISIYLERKILISSWIFMDEFLSNEEVDMVYYMGSIPIMFYFLKSIFCVNFGFLRFYLFIFGKILFWFLNFTKSFFSTLNFKNFIFHPKLWKSSYFVQYWKYFIYVLKL